MEGIQPAGAVGQQTLGGRKVVGPRLLGRVRGAGLGFGRPVVVGRLLDATPRVRDVPGACRGFLLGRLMRLRQAVPLADKSGSLTRQLLGALAHHRVAGRKFRQLAGLRVPGGGRCARIGQRRIKAFQSLGATFDALRKLLARAFFLSGFGFERRLAGVEGLGARGYVGGARLQMHQTFAQLVLPSLEGAQGAGGRGFVLTTLPQFGVMALRVQLGRRRLPSQLGGGSCRERRHTPRHGLLALLGFGDLPTDGVQPVPQQRNARGPQLGFELPTVLGDLGLAPEGFKPGLDFGYEIAQSLQVAARPRETPLGLVAAGLEPANARHLFEEAAPLLRPLPERRVDLSLAHDRSPTGPDPAGAHQVDNVAETHPCAVERVFAVPRAEQAAANDDFGVWRWQPGVGVVEYQQHLGHSGARARGGAAEDHFLGPADAKGSQRLFPERPANGVGEVALARPVGTDDGSYAVRQLDNGAPRECLEALQLDASQMHSVSRSRSTDEAPRAPRPVRHAACSSLRPAPAARRRP